MRGALEFDKYMVANKIILNETITALVANCRMHWKIMCEEPDWHLQAIDQGIHTSPKKA